MTLDHQQRHLATIRSVLSLAVMPLQYVVHLPEVVYQDLRAALQSRSSLISENASLHSEHLLLKARLQRLDAIAKENERLKALLQSSAQAGDRVLVARLLQVDPDPYSHRVVLDKGTRNGIYIGQPVLDAYGVMGQITQVGPMSSIALLVTDMSHGIPVQSNRSGARSIAVGTGTLNQLELNHVTNTSDLKEGDLLVSSGLGQRFPPGYPVGVIQHIAHDAGQPFIRVQVQPSAHVDRSREVLLVWPEGQHQAHPVQVSFSLSGTAKKGSHAKQTNS